ncbi:MAG TPA: hypothetical protein VMM15_33325 [Bradyrhizobium sp.]|nr:hypothetical protein [Bradyrhizobium sp.]
MINWVRSKAQFETVAVATAFVLAFQLIIAQAVAASMQVTNLLMGETHQLCATVGLNQESTGHSGFSPHKASCDECAFAAQLATASGFRPFSWNRALPVVHRCSIPAASCDHPDRYEPRSSQGPPLDF